MAGFEIGKRVQAVDTDISRWCNGKIVKIVDSESYEVSFDGWRSSFNRVLHKEWIREPIDDSTIIRRRFVRNGENNVSRSDAQRLIKCDKIFYEIEGEIKEGDVDLNDPFLDIIILTSREEIPYSSLRNTSTNTPKKVRTTRPLTCLENTPDKEHQPKTPTNTNGTRKRKNKGNAPSKTKKRKSEITVLGHKTTEPYQMSDLSENENESDDSLNENDVDIYSKMGKEIFEACEAYKRSEDLDTAVTVLGLQPFPSIQNDKEKETNTSHEEEDTAENAIVQTQASDGVSRPNDQENGMSEQKENVSWPNDSEEIGNSACTGSTHEEFFPTIGDSTILNCLSSSEVTEMKEELYSLRSSVETLTNKVVELHNFVAERLPGGPVIADNALQNAAPSTSNVNINPPEKKIVEVSDKLFWNLKICDFPSCINTNTIHVAISEISKKQLSGRFTPDGCYHIHKHVVREAEVEGSSDISKYARSLCKRIFSVGEIYNRNVKGRAKVKGGTTKKPINLSKIEAVKEEAFRFFPINNPYEKTRSWQLCINEINRHVLYWNRKIQENINVGKIVELLPDESHVQ